MHPSVCLCILRCELSFWIHCINMTCKVPGHCGVRSVFNTIHVALEAISDPICLITTFNVAPIAIQAENEMVALACTI